MGCHENNHAKRLAVQGANGMPCAAGNEETIVRLHEKALALHLRFAYPLQNKKAVVAIRMNILFAFTARKDIDQVELDLLCTHRLAVDYRSSVCFPMFWRTHGRQSGCMYQLCTIRHFALCKS